jgi:hypothetical protein
MRPAAGANGSLTPALLAAAALLACCAQARAVLLDIDESTAVASSVEKTGTEPPKAFDDDTSTRWASTFSDDQWIRVDLGQDYELLQVLIDWELAHSEDYTLRIRTDAQGLDNPTDPANWTEIASVFGRADAGEKTSGGIINDTFDFVAGTFTPETGSVTSWSVSTGVTGRYLMMYGTARATGFGHSIWELDVDAVPEPASLSLLSLGAALLLRRRRDH